MNSVECRIMPFDLVRDSAILARTPDVVRSILGDLDPAWSHAHYGPATWSPHEIVGHYVFGEMTDWIPRAQLILASAGGDGVPTFESFDRDGHTTMCREKTTDALLDEFASLRAQNVATLESMPLTPENLTRRAQHPELGPVTLDHMLCAWVVHDLHHIGHICKALAHQHKGDAGPWSAYLSILDPPAPR